MVTPCVECNPTSWPRLNVKVIEARTSIIMYRMQVPPDGTESYRGGGGSGGRGGGAAKATSPTQTQSVAEQIGLTGVCLWCVHPLLPTSQTEPAGLLPGFPDSDLPVSPRPPLLTLSVGASG